MHRDSSCEGVEKTADVVSEGAPCPDFKEEREELERVLNHPEINRSQSLMRFLSYVCRKYFEGETDDIREYTIAVEALGRKESSFDSHIDPIVRVTARSLRKKLWNIYHGSEQTHRLEIVLPLGHYIPQFVRPPEKDPVKPVPENVSNTVETESVASVQEASSPRTAARLLAHPGFFIKYHRVLVQGALVLLFAPLIFFSGYYCGWRTGHASSASMSGFQSGHSRPPQSSTILAPAIQWQPKPVKAGSSVASIIMLHAQSYAGRVHVACFTDPATAACTLANSIVDFSNTLSQDDSVTVSTEFLTSRGRVIARPGRYQMTITATTISGDRSQLTVPFEVRASD
jgi:hypothetical protein